MATSRAPCRGPPPAAASAPPPSSSAPSPPSSSAGAGAGAGAPRKLKWWEKGLDLPNVVAVEGTEGLLEAMALAGDRLVMVAFYATWCGACRMVHPKLLQLAGERPEDLVLLKVNFDRDRAMCKSLGVKVLPFFHFYRGADGKLAEFTASLKRVQRIRDALVEHSSERCSLSQNAEADLEVLLQGLRAQLEQAEGEGEGEGEAEGQGEGKGESGGGGEGDGKSGAQ